MDYFRIQSEMNSPILTFVRTSSKDPSTWCISLIRKKTGQKNLKWWRIQVQYEPQKIEKFAKAWFFQLWCTCPVCSLQAKVWFMCKYCGCKKKFRMFTYKKSLQSQMFYLMCFQKCTLYCILFKLFNTRSQIYCWLET